MQTKRFMLHGSIVAGTMVLIRGVSVVFNAYVTKQIGAEGIGLFGLIMSVYSFFTTLSTSGVSLAATRLATEEETLGHHGGIRHSIRACLFYALFFGLVSFGTLFFFATYIGKVFLGDERTVLSLKVLAVSMPFIGISACVNGYFIGVRRVYKNAVAQAFEFMVKCIVTIKALSILVSYGIEYACVSLVAGGTVAEVASFFLAFLLFKLDVKRYKNGKEGEKKYSFRMAKVALPVAVSSYLRTLLVTLEHILVPRGLQQYGAKRSAALAQYGVVHGMVLPVLQFPMAILSAFAGLLVPELATFNQQKKTRGIHRVVSRVFRISSFFAVGTAGIFFIFGDALGMAIYHSGDAGLFFKVLAPLVLVMYLDHVTDFMLKGLNKQVYTMGCNILDSFFSVVALYFLLPRFGVMAYVAVIFGSELFNASLSIFKLLQLTEKNLLPLKRMFVSVVLIVAIGFLVRFLWERYVGPVNSLGLFICLVLTTVLYGASLYITEDKTSLQVMP